MKWIYFCLIIWQTWMTVGSWWPGYIIGMKKCRENGQFYCNVSRRCISKSDVCDGYNGCSGGEDESPPACAMDVCLKKGFHACNVSQRCIRKDKVCDGNTDCPRGEDETPPACTMDVCLKKGFHACNVSQRCIRKDKVCNGNTDCPKGEDETPPACTMETCRHKGFYFCNCNRMCIHSNYVCDGNNHCANGEDEVPLFCTLRKRCEMKNMTLSEGCFGRCKRRFFGESCEKTCKKCLNGICNKTNGICKDCTRTYLENCSLKCDQGCAERKGSPQCDRHTGKCLNGCNQNRYGYYCNATCGHCNSSSNPPCNINGECLLGCENGYWGKKCNTKCSANCQGDEHGNRCNSSTGECINGCTNGWSDIFCLASLDVSSFQTTTTISDEKENDATSNTTLIVISAMFTVSLLVVGITCYLWIRKRSNSQQNESIQPRRVFRAVVPPGQQPSRSRRRESSHVYADVNEETMDHYHYICEQNPPDHYDKIKDRPPCICRQCVRERVLPFLNRLSSDSSDTTDVEPYATGGGSIRSKQSIHSYVSHSELNPRRSVVQYDSERGIVRPKEDLMVDSNSRRSVTKSEGNNELGSTDDKNPRRRVTKSEGNIELECTHEYLDLEALYQTAKAEDRRKLAAKYFDEGEEVFGVLGQIELHDIHANEREECEPLNDESEHQIDEQTIDSSF
ncbi:multiple epidermal growth factor-like domains protein 10 [Mya arenaria]|uniref:multiple epidermal growth factor-like domains protein 10 n=1 Tax=Mya arenaria TaxID=6604 RepID=UPI0022E94465|nr:multiple epidermal growth factor-like domains protein 10 [Mya arenaria]